MVEEYLLSRHRSNILQILNDTDIKKPYCVNISFVELFEYDTNIGNNILKNSEETLEELAQYIVDAQGNLLEELKEDAMILKQNVFARVYGLPICPELHRSVFPKNEDLDLFLQVTGTVVRVTSSKMLEYQRPYMCTKCKYTEIIQAVYDQKYIIIPPKKCQNPEKCAGTNLASISDLDVENCKDYQEIKIQEQPSKLGVGTMPGSLWVTLEDDLVDACKPGDDVTICGTVKRRWGALIPGKRIEVELVLKANHIQVNNDIASPSLITPEVHEHFVNFWKDHENQPLLGRDLILKSFCPKLYGMYLVKLAVAMILAGGSRCTQGNDIGIQIRSEPHILMVGDPGTGKSQLLRYAAKIIPRSVLTTGVGTTSAGLTCAAVMEDGQWQLEGGALVLADGGICCIDEFNSMKPHDRTSIHEAMEQQTISVAKASMVCKLRTRCSILAATNPKGGYLDPSQPLSLNLALPSPLLSRFDIVLMLKDNYDKDWDNLIADYILSGKGIDAIKIDASLWNLEMLQRYFTIIRNLNPALTPQANKILSNYYQVQRRAISRNKARTTVRLLDSLVRLSQAHARLMFHTEVQVMDALFAVILIESSMHGECSVVLLEPINVQGPFSESPMEDYRRMLKIILGKLGLNEMLRDEMFYLQNDITQNSLSASNNAKTEDNDNNKILDESHFAKTSVQDEDTSKAEDSFVDVKEKSNNDLSFLNFSDHSGKLLELPKTSNEANNFDETVINNSTGDNLYRIENRDGKENIKKNQVDKYDTTLNKQKNKILTNSKKSCNETAFMNEDNHTNRKKRKSSKLHDNPKQDKAAKKSNLNDFQMLNLIRSVNDEFDPNILDFINDDNETESEMRSNIEEEVLQENNHKSPTFEDDSVTKLSQNTKLKHRQSLKPKNIIQTVGTSVNEVAANTEFFKNETVHPSQKLFTSKNDDHGSLDLIQNVNGEFNSVTTNANSESTLNTEINVSNTRKQNISECENKNEPLDSLNKTKEKLSLKNNHKSPPNQETNFITKSSKSNKINIKEKFSFKPRNILNPSPTIVPVNEVTAITGRSRNETAHEPKSKAESSSCCTSQSLFTSKDDEYNSLNLIEIISDEVRPNADVANTVKESPANIVATVYGNLNKNNSECDDNEKSSVLLNKNKEGISSKNEYKSPNHNESSVTEVLQNTKSRQFKDKFSFKSRNVPSLNIPLLNEVTSNADLLKNESINKAEPSLSFKNFESLFTSKDEDYESLDFEF